MEPIWIGFAAVAVAAAVSLADWRKGLLACVAMGFVQDPLRKVWPEEPVYVTAFVGVVFAAVACGAARRGELLAITRGPEWRRLRWPLAVLALLVALQASRTLVEYGNAALAGLGLAAYLTPLVAAAVGYAFVRSVRATRRLLAGYAVVSVAAGTGIYLSFLGYDWPILAQVGTGLILYVPGMELQLHPGFMRSPEVAAWHAAAAVCVLVVLHAARNRAWAKASTVLAILCMLGAVVLTGRRKALVAIVLFAVVYWVLLARARLGARRVAGIAALTALAAWLIVPGLLAMEDFGEDIDPYLRHSATGFADAPDRLAGQGLGSVWWAMQRHGVAGAGVGTGSQGSQHFGGGATLVGYSAEGGLGKVATELGLPGLLVLVWLMVEAVRAVWRGRADARRLPADVRALRYGLLAFLGANAVSFVVASQVYGDLFVLLMLGWTAGFVLALPRLPALPPASGAGPPPGRRDPARCVPRTTTRARVGEAAGRPGHRRRAWSSSRRDSSTSA